MNTHLIHIKLLFKRILLIYILFFISRLLFLVFNFSYFNENSFLELLKIFIVAIFFDGIPITLFNSLFIFLHIIPFKIRSEKKYQKILFYLYIIVNSILLLANFVDIEYFKFTNKRTTFDVFNLMFTGDDIKILLPEFLKDFWYIVLLWISTIFLMIKFYPKLKKSANTKYTSKSIVIQVLVLMAIVLIFIILSRGISYRPAGIATAAKYTKSSNIPLMLNTPFTILKTINKRDLKEKKYFSKTELKTIFNPIKKYQTDSSFKKLNVVIIILESFGKDYTGKYNNTNLTPFLDSLTEQSLSFKYSFANGKKSLEAVPAIITSIPALSDNPYILSQYSVDDTHGLAEILKEQGYNTSFFHGGINGTMGFDNFALANGFDNYYGKNEYNNDKDYDGTWGIYDEAFFQYFAKKLSDFKKPFFSVVFTLSSHHPYNIPEKYKNKFPEGRLPIHKAIAYADYSLKRFFETASKTKWFENTVFILTADHTSYTNSEFYGNKTGMYSIPILYYCPKYIKPKELKTITQQIDIMPSVLDFLNYNKDFFCFGNSVFSNEDKYAVNYISGVYQLFENNYSYQFDGTRGIALFNFKKDKLLKNNILESKPEISKQMDRKIKAIIQTYNDCLINNKLTAKNYKKTK